MGFVKVGQEIRGIKVPALDWQVAKFLLYIDNIIVSCTDQHSGMALIQTFEKFVQASRAKINCGKSEAMLFAKWVLTSSNFFRFSIKPDINLGVCFGKEAAALFRALKWTK